MKLSALIFFCGCAALAFGELDYSDCFFPGEVSEYKVTWMKVPLSWSKSTTEAFEENGRKLIKLTMISQTYKAYKHIYEVDDKSEVIIDPKTALPLRFDFVLNEGSRSKSHYTTFDHKNRQAVFIDRIENTTNTVEIAEDTRDILSYLYAVRKTDLTELAKQTHKLFVDGKIYDLKLKIGEEKQLKIDEHGKVDCVEIEPVAEFDGLFLRQGKIAFWVSKPNRRMITCVEAKVPVGKINVKLQSVAGPGDDFWTQKEKSE